MLIATSPMSWAFARRKLMRACRPWIRFACCAATHSAPA
ncbi:MAG TPA: protein GbcA, partial [Pseudomonas sp.]|nr:protein GbcA [Pseudomonas sp.]